MSQPDRAFAIRQSVRNNSIVRQVDRERVRTLWHWAAIVIVLGGVLVFSAWQHFQVLRFGYLIEGLRKQQVEEEESRRHLMLERAVLLRPQRLEQLATERLHLVQPGAGSTIVIERVSSGTPPGRGVVASR